MNSIVIRIIAIAAMGAAGWLLVGLGSGPGDRLMAAGPEATVAAEPNQSNALRELQWADLLPDDVPVFRPPTTLFDAADHDEGRPLSGNVMWSETGQKVPASPFGDAGMPRAELNGQRISLAGYMTPFNVEGGMTRTFLLVPYVGACIHVPAPPPNQIVLVEAPEPVEVLAMWEPFKAVGSLRVETIDTGLAEVGYTMALERIDPYTHGSEKLEGVRSANDGD